MKTRPRIGIHLYFPPGLGGGERYLLTAASELRALGDVDFLCPVAADLSHFAASFGLDLEGVRAVRRPRRRFHSYRDWFASRPYDLFLALDNHLAPMQLCLGRRGILHLQTPPYPPHADRPLRARWKLHSYDVVVCNSEYTRKWALRYGTAGLPTRVLYPPVDVELYRALEKKPLILSVGRFFTGRHEKKHAAMIAAFRQLVDSGLRSWELHFAGDLRQGQPLDVAYLEDLRALAAGLPVRFHVSASLEEVRRLYGEASIYWHATGYDVDEDEHPQFLEHFGMSIVEAMAAAAVPIVVGKGGPLEIVREGSGFTWRTPDELREITRRVVRISDSERLAIGRSAAESVARFSRARFGAELRALAGELFASGRS